MCSDGQQKTRPGRSAVRMREAGGGQRGGSTGAVSLVRSAPHPSPGTLIGFVVLVIQLTRAAFRTSDAPPAARRVVVGALGAIGVVGALLVTESAVHGAAVRQLELVITLALNQLTVAAALVYWPKPVGKHGGYDEYGASATAAMMQKYGSV